MPNELILTIWEFPHTSILNPDYIEAESGSAYSSAHGNHEMKQTIFCNAEEIDQKVAHETIDNIFSVACLFYI